MSMRPYLLKLKLCTLISCTISFSLFAKTTPSETMPLKELKVCSEAGYIPFEMKDAHGGWDGYEVKILEKFAAAHKYSLVLKDTAYEGLIPSLVARKRCDIVASTLAVNMERGKMVQYSKPILVTHFSAIVRKEDIEKYKNFEAVNSKNTRIAVQNGTENDSYASKFLKKATLVDYSNSIDPVLAITTHKADIYMEDINYLRLIQKKYPQKLALLDFQIIPHNPDVAIAFAMRKTDQKLVDKMNVFLDKISQNGELDALKKDYFEDMVWQKRFPY